MPGRFRILDPAIEDTLKLNRGFQIIWSKSWKAKRYLVCAYLLTEGGRYTKLWADTPETSMVVCPTDSGKYQLKVLAMDQNYWDYYRGYQGGNPNAGYICHLQGGVGVFGSVNEDWVWVEVQ